MYIFDFNYTENMMCRIVFMIELYNVHVKCLEYTEDMMIYLQNCIIELYVVHVKCLEYTEDMMIYIYRTV